MSNFPETIAIDGPAASGKSTVGRLLAEHLGYLYLDTGAMYRAVTLLALEAGADPNDESAVAALALMPIDIVGDVQAGDGRHYSVLVAGRDVTWKLRSTGVDEHVSAVAAHPAVRQLLVEQQRRLAREQRVVMVGRDIGTVVLPDADFKVYLEAPAEERARRRHVEREARGEEADYQAILREMQERDRRDSTRAMSPLRPADDARVIDSTDLSAQEVVELILRIIAEETNVGGNMLPPA